jgi:hypothetical protein
MDRPSATATRLVGRWRRRSFIGCAAIAAPVASAIAVGPPAFAQNYCIPHPAADGCSLPGIGPHIAAAGISTTGCTSC